MRTSGLSSPTSTTEVWTGAGPSSESELRCASCTRTTTGPSTGRWSGVRRTGTPACSAVTGAPSPTAWSVPPGPRPRTQSWTWGHISSECCKDERTRRRKEEREEERSDGPERDRIALESVGGQACRYVHVPYE